MDPRYSGVKVLEIGNTQVNTLGYFTPLAESFPVADTVASTTSAEYKRKPKMTLAITVG